MTTQVSDANFGQEVLNAKEPVLVDFWAEWCGPCRAISPLLEELSTELAGKVKIVKLNIDENPDTTVKYGVPVDSDDDPVQEWRSRRHEDWRGHAQGRPQQMAEQPRRLIS